MFHFHGTIYIQIIYQSINTRKVSIKILPLFNLYLFSSKLTLYSPPDRLSHQGISSEKNGMQGNVPNERSNNLNGKWNVLVPLQIIIFRLNFVGYSYCDSNNDDTKQKCNLCYHVQYGFVLVKRRAGFFRLP